jgi:hypothetical protein
MASRQCPIGTDTNEVRVSSEVEGGHNHVYSVEMNGNILPRNNDGTVTARSETGLTGTSILIRTDVQKIAPGVNFTVRNSINAPNVDCSSRLPASFAQNAVTATVLDQVEFVARTEEANR